MLNPSMEEVINALPLAALPMIPVIRLNPSKICMELK
jgi:hypothetical protein